MYKKPEPLDTVYDFLFELDMKPHVHLVEISNVTARPTKIMNSSMKTMENFNKFSTLKNDFENQKFEMFEEVVHSFDNFDGDIIQGKKSLFSIDA